MITKYVAALKDADTIVIIGSSPILLLTAISLARRGKKVSIISSNTEWGGAWKYSSFDNNFIDIACHLLESNKRVHDLLRAYNVNLRKCTLGNEAVKYIANSEKENANIFLYHSKLQVLQEMFTRFRRLIFAFLKYLISSDAEKGFSLETALNELIIYLRFRASQLFNLEPLHIPSNGWSNFVIDLTNEARQNSVHFIDDFVSDIEDRGLFFVAKTNKEITLYADLFICSQSASFQKLTVHKAMKFSLPYKILPRHKSYPHYLVEVEGIPANIDLPFYVHFPTNKNIHRIAFSFFSNEGNHCFLVQLRDQDVNDNTFKSEVALILNHLVNRSFSESFRNSTYPLDNKLKLSIKILEKLFPNIVEIKASKKIKPGLTKNWLTIKSIGDLSKSIAYNIDLF